MTTHEKELKETRWRRMRRVKWWLRPLPRRSNIHRYPVLRFFANSAKKRISIWSFREEDAVPAIYAGCILTMMPLYGIQLPLALALAWWLKINLPIIVGLQIVSNPITVIPLWLADYQIGRTVLSVVGIEAQPLQRGEIRSMLDQFFQGNWEGKFERVISVFGVTSLGALVMGSFFGLIGGFTYRIVARRSADSYRLLIDKIHRGKETAEK